jgi:hypothetical protein
MCNYFLRVVILPAALCVSTMAEAQVIQRPPRTNVGLFGGRPADPNRSRQEVMLTANMLGGYDDNVNPLAGETGSSDPVAAGSAGYNGFSAVRLRYWRGRQARSIEVAGSTFMNTYRGVGLTPSYGGDVRARAATSLGRRAELIAYQHVRFEPFFAPGVPGGVRPQFDMRADPQELPPLVNPTAGFIVRRSRGVGGGASVLHNLTRRQTVAGGVDYDQQRFEDRIGDHRAYRAALDYGYSSGGESGMRASYSYSDTRMAISGVSQPMQDHTGTIGYSFERRLSATRRVSFTMGGGASQIETISTVITRLNQRLSYRTPAAYASARLDFARTWGIWADYGRRVSVLEGVTLQSFVNNSLALRTGGFIGSKVDVALSTRWTGGRQAVGTGSFSSYTAIAQAGFAATRWCTATVSHTFYTYRLENVTSLYPGMPNRLDRNAFRVGLMFNLPLYGRYVEHRPTGGV